MTPIPSPTPTATSDHPPFHTAASMTHRPRNITDIPQPTLLLDTAKVTDLLIEPGSTQFATWFIISSYVPIAIACLSSVADMMSVVALVSKWRERDGHTVTDLKSIYGMNAASLVLGRLANLALRANYVQRMNYRTSQIVSISLFFASGVILLAAVAVAKKQYFEGNDHYTIAGGFWYAVVTTVLYFILCFGCLINFVGYLLGKYPADFNLEKSERGLMAYTFLLCIWFLWGAAAFSQLLDISYGDAMYYCCTSLLVIGLGDILPDTNGTRALCLVFSFTGIIIIGLVISMIRTMIKTMSAPVLFWNQIEEKRKRVFRKVQREDITLTPQESFDLMRSIRREARAHRNNMSILITILIFVVFWLIGALVFHYTEGWAYFDAVYFCFLCLITVGYGDYAPSSAAGRPFFIVWALSAVPLMTCLISSVGETVYDLAVSGAVGKLLEKFYSSKKKTTDDETPMSEVSVEDFDSEVRSSEQIIAEAKRRAGSRKKHKLLNSRDIVQSLRKIMLQKRDDPMKKFAYEEWASVMGLLDIETDPDNVEDKGWFWISERSPLRYPINEPDYLLYLLFNQLEENIMDRAASLERELTTPSGSSN